MTIPLYGSIWYKPKLFFSMFLFIMVSLANGQTDPRDDFWNKVDKRPKQETEIVQTNTLKYDKDILDIYGRKIFIIKQEYVYERKNTRYVKGNDDYYGKTYGIGIVINNGILASKHLQHPWKNDKSLLPDKGYMPVLTNLSYRNLIDTTTSSHSEEQFSIDTASLLIRYSYPDFKGTEVEFASPDSLGLVVLFYHNIQMDSFWRKSIPFTIEWKDGLADLDTQIVKNELLGGVFFNMDTSVQKCQVELSGILGVDDTGKFKLFSITDSIQAKTKSKADPKNKNRSNPKVEKLSTIEGSKKLGAQTH